MPLSKNINTYSDIAQVLAAVVASGKERATWRLPTVGLAVRFVQRAYQYRLLLQRQLATAAGKGIQPETPYDRMRMTRTESDVLIDLFPPVQGSFVEDGLEVTPTRVVEVAATQGQPLKLGKLDTSFLAELEALAKENGSED